MIVSQGYWMDLECSDCGVKAQVLGDNKEHCKKEARSQGWSFSRSSLSCWCAHCKDAHTAKANMWSKK